MSIKVNIGCGYKKEEGFINIDADPLTEPDHVIDLEKAKLPFEDDTVDEVRAWHILEHIGEGFLPLMKEIYRTCKKDAVIDIQFPYHRHDMYFADPTHKRPLTISSFTVMGKKFCDHLRDLNQSSSGIAYNFDIDFEYVKHTNVVSKEYQNTFQDMVERQDKKTVSSEEIQAFNAWSLSTNNVIQEVWLQLKVIK